MVARPASQRGAAAPGPSFPLDPPQARRRSDEGPPPEAARQQGAASEGDGDVGGAPEASGKTECPKARKTVKESSWWTWFSWESSVWPQSRGGTGCSAS